MQRICYFNGLIEQIRNPNFFDNAKKLPEDHMEKPA